MDTKQYQYDENTWIDYQMEPATFLLHPNRKKFMVFSEEFRIGNLQAALVPTVQVGMIRDDNTEYEFHLILQ